MDRATRFFRLQTFNAVGGYNQEMISGEDWDLSNRIAKLGPLSTIDEYIYHNEGNINFVTNLRKKYYYAQHATTYLLQNPQPSLLKSETGPLQRYKLFLSDPGRLFKNPVLGICMLLMKTCEFTVGAAGYMKSRNK